MATIALTLGNIEEKYNLSTYDGFVVEVPYLIIDTINLINENNTFLINYSYILYKSDKDLEKTRINASLSIYPTFTKDAYSLSSSILEMCYDDIISQIPEAKKVDDRKKNK